MLRSVPRRRPWVWALAAGAVCLFAVGLAARLAGWPVRLLGLDTVGGLPRLFTTGLFVATACLAWAGARRAAGPARRWWTGVALTGAALAVAKLVSVHSAAKADSYGITLGVGVALSVVALGLLWSSARRWGVVAGPPVVLALAVYAAAALGLDVVTGALAGDGPVADAVSTFVEELSEALSALLVLATVALRAPARPVSGVPR